MKKIITYRGYTLEKTAEFQYQKIKYTIYKDVHETLFFDERYVFKMSNSENPSPFYVGLAKEFAYSALSEMKNPCYNKLPKEIQNCI